MGWLLKPAIQMPAVALKQSDDQLIGAAYSYGMGFFLGHLDGWEYNYHGGDWSPYVSLMSLLPSQNLGIYTSVNEGPLMLDRIVPHAFIFELLKGTPAKEAREKAMNRIEKLRKRMKIRRERGRENILEQHKGKGVKSIEEIVGKYGSGSGGDLEIYEKLNPVTNITQLYVDYGKWNKGWMESVGGDLYEISWDTDIDQFYWTMGELLGKVMIVVGNDSIKFVTPNFGGNLELTELGTFWRDVSLDKLPPIPWDPESCGPEQL